MTAWWGGKVKLWLLLQLRRFGGIVVSHLVGSWGGGGEWLLLSHWSFVVFWASARSRPFRGSWGRGDMPVSEAFYKLIPIFSVVGFSDPVLEGSIVVNGHFRYFSKKKT